MKKIWEDVYVEYPLIENNLMKSHWWFEYAQTYLDSKELLAESFKIQDLIEVNNKGLRHTHKLNQAKKYLTAQALEYYEAAYIFSGCMKNWVG